MSYRIEYAEEARRAIPKVPGNYRHRIRRLIESLAENPRPRHCRRLRDEENIYRIALDKWRIVYVVADDLCVVTIIRIRPKAGPETYHNLPAT